MAVEDTIVETSAVAPKQKRFTVDEYHRMIEAAILDEDDRVELINGAIVEMSPLGSPHISCVIRLDRILNRFVPDTTLFSVQNSMRLNNLTEPQPDVILLRYRDDFYASQHPAPEDVLLLIEVSDSTLALDQKVKVPMYARSGIPETWIVDMVHKRIEVYSEPNGDRYDSVRVYERGDTVDSPTVEGLRVDVSAVIP